MKPTPPTQLKNPDSCNPPAGNELPGDTCGSCPQAHECRTVWSQPNQGPFNSAGLVLSSITAFLLPILTAALGGAIAQNLAHTRPWMFTGTILGLATGILIAWLLVPQILKKCGKADNQDQTHL